MELEQALAVFRTDVSADRADQLHERHEAGDLNTKPRIT